MSSAKPSPHRFLTHKPRQKQQTKPSSLRHAFPAPAQTPQSKHTHRRSYEFPDETPKVTPAKRFVGKERAAEEWRDTETYGPNTARKKPATRTLERVESIEGSSQTTPSASEDDEDAEMLFQSENPRKRRRTSPPAEHSSSPHRPSSSRSMLPPQTPVQNTVRFATPALSASSHRFIIPAPRNQTPFSNTSTASQTPQTHSRPHFLLPPQQTSPHQPVQPLPEHFSPSRKGQKYIPGGVASMVQSWIIETANTGFATQTRDAVVWGRDKEEGVKMRVKIRTIQSGNAYKGEGEGVECFNGGVVFVSGDADVGLYNASRMPPGSAAQSEHETRVLLAGQGGARGLSGVKIKERSVVGIRAPLWDVEIAGEKWVVAVDWILLS
ncbi:hypothetical protein BDV96DRAFT_507273 [Lophiotrema nucula]|uniref:Uncharacterized protein n=1 Tax=Lophiotrema nucula TaxID=690887 RepID=A0A6A5YJB7_9PLEO|nr:hypothetical protein BDV96DRAFT_507273 [Lophiotrema nucula]